MPSLASRQSAYSRRTVPNRSRATKADRDNCQIRCIDARGVDRAQRAEKSLAAIQHLAETFKVLGDPTRLRIAHALAPGELCVCDLAAVLRVSQSVVSHSLRSLRQMHLVRYRREGKVVYYTLDDDRITAVLAEGFRHVDEES